MIHPLVTPHSHHQTLIHLTASPLQIPVQLVLAVVELVAVRLCLGPGSICCVMLHHSFLLYVPQSLWFWSCTDTFYYGPDCSSQRISKLLSQLICQLLSQLISQRMTQYDTIMMRYVLIGYMWLFLRLLRYSCL